MGSKILASFRPTYLRVLNMLADGHSLNEIARRLNAQDVPTSRGGRWYASTIRAIRDSKTAENLTDDEDRRSPGDTTR